MFAAIKVSEFEFWTNFAPQKFAFLSQQRNTSTVLGLVTVLIYNVHLKFILVAGLRSAVKRLVGETAMHPRI